MPNTYKYTVGKDVYDIPTEERDKFEKQYPDAKIGMYGGGEYYDIPLSEVDNFINSFADAQFDVTEDEGVIGKMRDKVSNTLASARATGEEAKTEQEEAAQPEPAVTDVKPSVIGKDHLVVNPISKETDRPQPTEQQPMQLQRDPAAELGLMRAANRYAPEPPKTGIAGAMERIRENQEVEAALNSDAGEGYEYQGMFGKPGIQMSTATPMTDEEKAEANEQEYNDMLVRRHTAVAEEREEPTVFDTIWKSVGSSIARTGAGLIDAYNGLFDGMNMGATSTFSPVGIASLIGDFVRGKYIVDPTNPNNFFRVRSYEEMLQENSDPVTRLSTFLNDTADRWSQEAQPRNNKGFVDMIMDGDIGGILQKGVAVSGESLLMTLSAYNPYTMLANAISMAGTNYRQNTLDNPDVPEYLRKIQAMGSAAIEQAVEKYSDPVFKYIGGSKGTKQAVDEVTQKATNDLAKRILSTLGNLAKDAAGEGTEEIVSNVGNDALGQILDWLSGREDYGLKAQYNKAKQQNPNLTAWDFSLGKAKEAVDAFIGGALAGVNTSAPVQVTTNIASGIQTSEEENRRFRKANDMARMMIGEGRWNTIKQRTDEVSDYTVDAAVRNIVNDTDMNNAEKYAALGYLHEKAWIQGSDIQSVNDAMALVDERSKVAAAMANGYKAGSQALLSPDGDPHSVQVNVNNAAAGIDDALRSSIDGMIASNSTPEAMTDFVLQLPEDVRSNAMAYIEARSSLYGIQDAANDDIKKIVRNEQEAIEPNIYNAVDDNYDVHKIFTTVNYNGQMVYVRNYDPSSPYIHIVDPETGEVRQIIKGQDDALDESSIQTYEYDQYMSDFERRTEEAIGQELEERMAHNSKTNLQMEQGSLINSENGQMYVFSNDGETVQLLPTQANAETNQTEPVSGQPITMKVDDAVAMQDAYNDGVDYGVPQAEAEEAPVEEAQQEELEEAPVEEAAPVPANAETAVADIRTQMDNAGLSEAADAIDQGNIPSMAGMTEEQQGLALRYMDAVNALAEENARRAETQTAAAEPAKPTIPVDKKTGVKLYEQGVELDDAIEDIKKDGFTVSEVADISIAEAQKELEKVQKKVAKGAQTREELYDSRSDNPKTEYGKALRRAKELQGVIDYYTSLKAREEELGKPAQEELENVAKAAAENTLPKAVEETPEEVASEQPAAETEAAAPVEGTQEETKDPLIEAYEREQDTVDTEGGLVGDEVAEHALPENWRGALHSLGRHIGRRIVILSDKSIRERGYDPDKVSGYAQGNTVYISERAAKDNGRLRSFIAGHELTHMLKKESPEVWNAFVQSVKTAMGDDFADEFAAVKKKYDDFYDAYNEKAEEEGRKKLTKLTDDEIDEEVCCNWAGRHMLQDEEAVRNIVEEAANAGADPKSLIKKVLDWINGMLESLKAALKRGENVSDSIDAFNTAKKIWQDMYNIATAKNNARKEETERLAENGMQVDEEKGDVRHALADILDKDEFEQSVKDLMKVTGRSEKTVRKWLKTEQSLANVILDNDNAKFLDMQVDESVPSIWNNSDYPQGTVEFSNICRKRLPLTMIYQRLQQEFPNTVFDANTLETIRQVLIENGIDVACGLCYVEERRQHLGEIGNGFISMLKGEAEKVNDNQRRAFERLQQTGDTYIPNLYDLLTLDGMKTLRKEHPAVAQAFVEYNNARGQQAGRLFQAYSAYHREILNYSPSKVKSINDNGGLRIFSFSDFEAHHLIDLVQVLADCATKGIKVQGYTKVPEFAKAVKDTGMKLNRSLIPKGVGYVDADYVPKEGEAVSPNVINGKRLLFDCVEGIDVNHPDFFDSTDSKSVGNIVVGINDEHIRLAMLDPFVDYIIPFHTKLKEDIRKKKGIADWDNYMYVQIEKVLRDGKIVNASDHGINIYTDVLPRGNELIGNEIKNVKDFQKAFFAACDERGWIPRFDQFVKKGKNGEYKYTPGYEKLLPDFKLFDKNGKIIPQEIVVPIFDNDLNKRILEDYVKGEKEKMPNDEVYGKVKDTLGLDNPRFSLSTEIEAQYPNWMDNQTPEAEGKRGQNTQVAGTVGTYKKVGKWIEDNLGKDAKILDASSGLGLGTQELRKQGFDVEDIEPYPGKGRDEQPTYGGLGAYQRAMDDGKQYDYIISNAVLNVIPDDWRNGVLHDMATLLKEGGKMFINTRKAGEEKTIKNKIELESPQEVLVGTPDKITSYQRFFTPQELKKYVQDELGEGYTVTIANEKNSGTKGLAAVVVTKENPDGKKKTIQDILGTNKEEPRFSLRGEVGAANDPDAMANLSVAKDMDKEKHSAKSIWLATGWEKGADGKWRNEIPDIEAKPLDFDNVETIEDIVDAPELFAAYPQLKDYKVQFTKMKNAGSINHDDKLIKLDKDYNTDYSLSDEDQKELNERTMDYIRNGNWRGEGDIVRFKRNWIKKHGVPHIDKEGIKTIAHELQHAVQGIEGFARGGSVSGMAYEYLKELAERDPELSTFAKEFADFMSVNDMMRSGKKAIANWLSRDDMDADDETKSNLKKVADSMRDMSDAEFVDYIVKAKQLAKQARKVGEERYDRLAGEIEAKNVEDRLDMTEDERRSTPPSETEDLSRENQIVRFSISPEEDKAYMDAVEKGDMDKAQEMVDDKLARNGYTIRGEHGTTHKFTTFNYDYANAENSFGKGHYFTSDHADAQQNYTSGGADLTNRIERTAEEMEWMDGYEDMSYEERLEEARKQLDGGEERVISAALRMNNPVIFGIDPDGEYKETIFDFDEQYDEENDEYGEPEGLLVEFAEALQEVLDSGEYFGRDVNVSELYEDFGGYTADQLKKKCDEMLVDVQDEDGQLAGSDIFNKALQRMGFDGIIDNAPSLRFKNMGLGRGTKHYIVFDSNQIKQSDAVTYDDNGDVIPLSERANKSNPDIRFSLVDESPTFFSNAEKAVDGIKQEKATPEQWLKMIEKAGGLKAGEDKWMGLSDWLKESDKKTLTKDEVLDYIRKNEIQIEEVNYGELNNVDDNEKMKELKEEFAQIQGELTSEKENLEREIAEFDEEMYEKYGEGWYNQLTGKEREYADATENRYRNLDDSDDAAFKEMVSRYGDDFEQGFEVVGGELEPVNDYYEGISGAARYFLDINDKPINSTRMDYTTEGLENKREIALVVPSVEPYNENDEVHFGDAGEGRAVAWVRFGETTDADGNKVLVVDEIQSKRHQDGRDKGYQSDALSKGKEADEMRKRHQELVAKRNELTERDKKRRDAIRESEEGKALIGEDGYIKDGKTQEYQSLLDNDQELKNIEEEKAPITIELLQLEDKMRALNGWSHALVPDAPFEKNWHELAMKRMLRYAAENGYDKVAWTKGAQQADRYNIRNVVEDLYYKKNEDGTFNISVQTKDNRGHGDGRYVDYGVQTFPNQSEADLTNLLGKETAQKIIEGKGRKGYTFNGETGWTTFKGKDLKIGGEGMKGFYDQMLPRFMDKYGKKWGVKTGEVELPNLEKSGRKMWAVDVTPEMKESVMQGQPMFSLADEDRTAVESYDAGEPTFVERLTNSLLELQNRNEENTVARMNAISSIGARLSDINKAMRAQKEYDKGTVDSLVRLAKMLLAQTKTMLEPYEQVKIWNALAKVVGKKNITQEANRVVDVLVDSELRTLKGLLDKIRKTKGVKLNSSGVETMGRLDIIGQRLVNAFNDGLKMKDEDLQNRIAETNMRLYEADSPTARESIDAELRGLELAQRYHEEIGGAESTIAGIRSDINTAKEDPESVGISKGKERADYIRELQQRIRDEKISAIPALASIVAELSEEVKAGKTRAKMMRDEDLARKQEIWHDANSDLLGVPNDSGAHKKTVKEKWAENRFLRLALQPLATFNEMLRFFGESTVRGEGRLFNRFMPQFIWASDREWRRMKENRRVIDEKLSDIMGKKTEWSDLYRMESNMPTVPVTVKEGKEEKTYDLTQGNMLYIYIANKMTDGKVKLRKMGITEEDVEALKEKIDPRFIELADWIQSEFLPSKRKEFNEVHERMYGAPMADIEDYFPLEIDKNARASNFDVKVGNSNEHKPSTVTGSIIKRTFNTAALDITRADAFDVLYNHLQDMEHWAAFAEFSRDLNTLINYPNFKKKVKNMSSLRFGSGEQILKTFEKVAQIASGSHTPTVDRGSLDSLAVNIGKGVTMSKISFRLFTAMKQLLSAPAYISEASPASLAKYGTPVMWASNFNWAIENVPGFSKRWESRQAGDYRLKRDDLDWTIWNTRLVDKLSKWGMTPNAFVDALTVAIGARAIYETNYKRMMKDGYDRDIAHQRALEKATSYNETQQSSENAYLAPIQVDRTAASVTFTAFRNASMGYERRLARAVVDLRDRMKSGYKDRAVEQIMKQAMKDGLDEEQARKSAERIYDRGRWRDIADAAIFGYGLQFLWNLGPYIVDLLFGDDDDKEKALKDAAIHALFGPIEGLTGGNVVSDGINNIINGEWYKVLNSSAGQMPIVSDIKKVLQDLQKDEYAAIVDIVHLLMSSTVGVNPANVSDWTAAIMDAGKGLAGEDGDNLKASEELTLLLLRLAEVPKSQTDKFFLDRVFGESPRDVDPERIDAMLKRYTDYKRNSTEFLLRPVRDLSDEGREKIEDKWVKRFETERKERMKALANEDDAALIEKYEKEIRSDLIKKGKDDRTAEEDDLYDTYNEYKRYFKKGTDESERPQSSVDSISRVLAGLIEKYIADNGEKE